MWSSLPVMPVIDTLAAGVTVRGEDLIRKAG